MFLWAVGPLFGELTCWVGDWCGSMRTLVWEREKSPPGCTPPLFIHLLELHMSAGMAGNRPRPQAAGVGLGFSQLAAQMAVDGSQYTQEGGLQGEEKRTLLRFSLWRLQIRRVAVYNLGVRTFSARHHSEVEMAPWKNVSWYLIVIIQGYFIFQIYCIFQKPTNTGANHFISFRLFIEFTKIKAQNMQITPQC